MGGEEGRGGEKEERRRGGVERHGEEEETGLNDCYNRSGSLSYTEAEERTDERRRDETGGERRNLTIFPKHLWNST